MKEINILCAKNDAFDLLIELNDIPNVAASFSINKNIQFSNDKEHPLYLLDYSQISELVIVGFNTLVSITALVTSLMAYKNTLKEISKNSNEKVYYPVVVLKDKQLEVNDQISEEELYAIVKKEINMNIGNINIEAGLKIENQENIGGSHQFGDNIENK